MSGHRLFPIFFLLISIRAATGAGMVFGSEGFRPISPEELKMTSEPLAPGAPAVILYRQVDLDQSRATHDKGGPLAPPPDSASMRIREPSAPLPAAPEVMANRPSDHDAKVLTTHEENYFRIKILTEAGRRYGGVEIPYLKESQDVVGIHARTIKPDGSVVNFERQAIDRAIVRAPGPPYWAKTFTLPDALAGDIIEYTYTLVFRNQSLNDSHWILNHELFTKSAKFSLKPYERSDVTLRWIWHHLPPGAAPPVQGLDHFVRLELNNIPAFQREDHMPPADELKAHVDFIYTPSSQASETDRFWSDCGKRLNASLERFVGKRQDLEKVVAEMVNDPPEAKLRKIYARVQRLRNTSHGAPEIEPAGKRDKAKDSANAAEVWKRGYGNGGELNWLFLALARAAGLEAYGVWVPDRRSYFFHPEAMEGARLNNNVVLIKLPGKDIYCAPGAKFAPFGLLPWFETGVQGLRLDKDGSGWVTTPLPASSESRIERQAALRLSSAGSLEGKLTVTYTGLEAMGWRVEGNNRDETARQKLLEDEVKSAIPAASEVELTNHPDWDISAPNLVAEFNLKIPGWASVAGGRALVSAGIFGAAAQHTFEPAQRVHPIYFNYPFKEFDDVTLEIPAGWKVNTLPPGQSNPGRYVDYNLEVASDPVKLRVLRMLSVNFFLLEPLYYPSVRQSFQTARMGDEKQIVLLPGANP